MLMTKKVTNEGGVYIKSMLKGIGELRRMNESLLPFIVKKKKKKNDGSQGV